MNLIRIECMLLMLDDKMLAGKINIRDGIQLVSNLMDEDKEIQDETLELMAERWIDNAKSKYKAA